MAQSVYYMSYKHRWYYKCLFLPLSSLRSSVYSTSVNVVPFSLTGTPIDYSNVGTSVILGLSFNSQTTAQITQINVDVNGVLEDRFTPDKASGSVSFDFTQPTAAPLKVVWTATDQYGYSQSITYQYGTDITPSFYSNKVSVLQSANYTSSYPIELSGVSSGTGFYQQLLTINDPSKYGINTAGSNIQFSAPNGTLLYAWEQSINSSVLQVWVKNYYGNSVIDMQVLPSFENLFSATGYLGEAPELSSIYNSSNNAMQVFGDGYFFTGTTLSNIVSTIGSPTVIQDNGLLIYNNDSGAYYGAYLDVNYNNSKYELLFNAYYNNGGSSNPGPLNGFSDGGSDYAGLFAYGGSYYLATYNGTNHFSSAISMSTTTYNNYIFSLYNASSQGTGASLYYNGNYYNQTGAYSNFYGNPSYSNIELLTYNNYLFVHYVIPILKLPNGMPTISSIGTGSVFQANATTTSTFSGTTTGSYNATYSQFTYNVPIAPTTSFD